MTNTSRSKTSTENSSRFPIWAQLGLGIAVSFLLFYFTSNLSLYSSEWEEEDSNFYEIAMQSLRIRRINPSSPTLVTFWESDCSMCDKNIASLKTAPVILRVYGIHPGAKSSETDVRHTWQSIAPSNSPLVFDEDELLQTAFHVRSFPNTFLILPKSKKIFSYWGDLSKGRLEMDQIIAGE